MKTEWTNTVNRVPGGFVGGIMRTLGGSKVLAKKCRHTHATWIEARNCASRMEMEARS